MHRIKFVNSTIFKNEGGRVDNAESKTPVLSNNDAISLTTNTYKIIYFLINQGMIWWLTVKKSQVSYF